MVASVGDAGFAVGNPQGVNFQNAFSFKTGAQPSTLSDVTLCFDGGNRFATGFSLSLYAAFAGQPMGFLETLDGSPSPIFAGCYRYTGRAALLAEHRYWLVACAAASVGVFKLRATNVRETVTALPNWSIGELRGSFNRFLGNWELAPTVPQFMVRVAPTCPPVTSAQAVGAAALAAFVSIRCLDERTVRSV
jgi:hypothetical protein